MIILLQSILVECERGHIKPLTSPHSSINGDGGKRVDE